MYLFLACIFISQAGAQSGNEITDTIIDAIKQDDILKNEIDPAYLGSFTADDLEATDVTVVGLMSMKRGGPCNLTLDDSFTEMTLDSFISADNLRVTMNYKTKIWFITFRGDLAGRVDKILVKTCIKSPLEKITPKLERFTVVQMSDIYVTSATGASFLFNWLLTILARNKAKGLTPTVIKIVEDKVTDIINKNMDLLSDIIKKKVF